MNKLSFIIFLQLFIIPISYAHADTHVSGLITTDTVWTASSSPYIFDSDVFVQPGVSLTMGPGVVATSSPGTGILYIDGGSLFVNGTRGARVTLNNAALNIVNHSSAVIANADITFVYGMYINFSRATIATSTLRKTRGWALEIGNSIVSVTGSRIESNWEGINFNPTSGQMYRPGLTPATGENFGTSSFSMSGSVIVGNRYASFQNNTTVPADVTNNWWGTSAGPSFLPPNYLTGTAIYDPWLTAEPPFDPINSPPFQVHKPCCSNIVFIPGLEASRLYRDESGILGFGTSTNTLWEPNRNDDVRKLFLTASGTSADLSVYSGDPIGSAWGYGIYGTFMNFLDSLVSQKKINGWQPFGYDWRKPIPEIVLGTEKKATTTVSLLDMVTGAARSSKTGKVTLIAHSNGGLVAKYLVKTLADMGKSDLVDSVISVAVPYLGTPQAIGGVLHGDDESMGRGLILKTSVARQLGQNMPSAYSLLPSTRYFSAVPGPTILFSSTTPATINSDSYPKALISSADQSAFIADTKGVRTEPSPADIDRPIKGNGSLVAAAGSVHDLLDMFTWPASISRWAVVGWNALTAKSITYRASTHDPALPVHDILKTNMGDGTVVARSASYQAGTTTSIDLKKADGKNTEHANILNSTTTQGVINDLLQDTDAAAKERAIVSIPGVTLGEPDYSKEATYLVLSTHSPIQPHVYDSQGRHVGEIPPPPDTEDLYKAYDSEIPGSEFNIRAHNDTDYDTYIYLPDDGSKYSVELRGTGVGTFTFDVDRMRVGDSFGHAEYADLPVTPLTLATTTIQITPADTVATSTAWTNFNSSIQPLTLDVDGDGVIDVKAQPQVSSSTVQASPLIYLESFKNMLLTMYASAPATKNLVARINHLEDMFKKGKLKQVRALSESFSATLKHHSLSGLSEPDRQEILASINSFISQFESI